MSDDAAPLAPGVKTDCHARLVKGVFECVPCALAWDEGDPDARPPCSPATFERLAQAAINEALDIESRQRALVASGAGAAPLRSFRYRPALVRAMELRACALAIEKYRDLLRKHPPGGQQ